MQPNDARPPSLMKLPMRPSVIPALHRNNHYQMPPFREMTDFTIPPPMIPPESMQSVLPLESHAETTINSWLAKHGLSRRETQLHKKSQSYPSIGMVKKALQIVEKLDRRLWDGHLTDEQKVELESHLQFLESPNTKYEVKCRVKRARKRKERRIQKAKRLKEWHISREAVIKTCHADIDKWLTHLEGVKQKELLRIQADNTLQEVRKKVSDVEKQTQAIQAVIKLRAIRQQHSSKHGLYTTKKADEKFTEKTNALLKTLDERLTDYRAEEQALKVILDDEQARQAQVEFVREIRRRKRLEQNKQIWLFGSKSVPAEKHKPFVEYYDQAANDFEALLNIRHQWDQYIRADPCQEASSIPPGWVQPKSPSGQEWKKCLVTHNENQL